MACSVLTMDLEHQFPMQVEACLFLLFLRAMDEGEELLAQVMQEVLQVQLWSIGWPQNKKHCQQYLTHNCLLKF